MQLTAAAAVYGVGSACQPAPYSRTDIMTVTSNVGKGFKEDQTLICPQNQKLYLGCLCTPWKVHIHCKYTANYSTIHVDGVLKIPSTCSGNFPCGKMSMQWIEIEVKPLVNLQQKTTCRIVVDLRQNIIHGLRISGDQTKNYFTSLNAWNYPGLP